MRRVIEIPRRSGSDSDPGLAGIDLAAWSTCVTDPSSEAHRQASAAVSAQMALGDQLGVSGTPAFFVEGRMLSGAQPAAAFSEVLASVRAETNGMGVPCRRFGCGQRAPPSG